MEGSVLKSDQNIVYCKHYKKLIVEDFSFNENRLHVHYGKCAVIGLCTFDRGVYFLGNVRITSLHSDSQLPDNTNRVMLLTNLCRQAPPVDKFVEVFGESVLYDRNITFADEVSSLPCKTSLDLLRMRNENVANGVNINDFHSEIMRRFRPAIKVHEVITIDNAHEIINCNLRLTQIIQKT